MNLRERLQSIGFSFLTALFIISVIFIIVGLKSSEINWTFIIIGSAILVPFFIYLMYQSFLMSHEAEERGELYEIQLHKLKQTANRIPINLDNAIIQEKNHYYTKAIETGRSAAMNEFSGHGHLNEETVKQTSCEVTFKVNYNNEELTFGKTIGIGATSLRMQFYIKKETILYIDPFDTEHYHLDLDFVEN